MRCEKQQLFDKGQKCERKRRHPELTGSKLSSTLTRAAQTAQKPATTTRRLRKRAPRNIESSRRGLISGVKVQIYSVCNVTDSTAPSVTHPGESRPNIPLLLPDTKLMLHFISATQIKEWWICTEYEDDTIENWKKLKSPHKIP